MRILQLEEENDQLQKKCNRFDPAYPARQPGALKRFIKEKCLEQIWEKKGKEEINKKAIENEAMFHRQGAEVNALLAKWVETHFLMVSSFGP